MKKNSFAILFSLTLILSACANDADVSPTDTPVPTETPLSAIIPSDGPSSLDLSDPDSIKEIPGDYELTMEFTFTGTKDDGSPLEGSIILEGKQLSDAQASSMLVSASGAVDLGGVDSVEIVEVDDRIYFFNNLTGCIDLAADEEEDSLFNNLVDTSDFLTGSIQRAGPDEIVNGVPAFRFAITQENLDRTDPGSMDVTNISDSSMYIAKDGGYVVRLIIRGEGSSELLSGLEDQNGEIDYQLDFIPAEGLEIFPPSTCEEAGAPQAEYPILPDAQRVSAFGSLYSYESATPIELVLDFYKSELGADGWVLEQEISAGNTAVLLFTMDGRNLSIAITADPNKSGTLTIVIGEEG